MEGATIPNEHQKRREWKTFVQYLENHNPPLSLSSCNVAHVIEFIKYLEQFGKTKIHDEDCPSYGKPNPRGQCTCPLKKASVTLDDHIGRLRAAFVEIGGGLPESNFFSAKEVGIYLKEVRENQAKARGIPYDKKKGKTNPNADDGEGPGGGGAATMI